VSSSTARYHAWQEAGIPVCVGEAVKDQSTEVLVGVVYGVAAGIEALVAEVDQVRVTELVPVTPTQTHQPTSGRNAGQLTITLDQDGGKSNGTHKALNNRTRGSGYIQATK
jgi:hypothetical protein